MDFYDSITEEDKAEYIDMIKECPDLEGIMIITPRGSMWKGRKIDARREAVKNLKEAVDRLLNTPEADNLIARTYAKRMLEKAEEAGI